MSAVAPIDECFSLATTEAISMWQNGTPNEGIENGRQSENGRWLVRQLCAVGCDSTPINPELRCDLTTKETERFKKLGLHIISFAVTPDVSEGHVYVVSPWLDDMQACPEPLYADKALQPLRQYYTEKQSEMRANYDQGVYFLEDAEQNAQFSILDRSSVVPFMHDSDFYLGHSQGEASMVNFNDILRELRIPIIQNTNKAVR